MLTVIYNDGHKNRLFRTSGFNKAEDLKDFIENNGNNVVIIIEGKPAIWIDLYGEGIEEFSPNCISD